MAKEEFFKQLTLVDVKTHKDDVLPEKIGPYVIEALIAKSHFSIIYLGYHPENRQVVALKVLSPDFVQKKAMVSSFINEGSLIQMASHPNIVKLYAQGSWEGGLYLAMEFIRGVSLRQFIQQHSLSIKRSLDIVLQVCYALCHLHAHGIIHGDLKPENILITEDGEVKVLDFGIAKMHNVNSKDLSSAGTPSYMSPEHKTSVHNLTFSSDIYSLGIIAYELLTGKLSYGVIHTEKLPEPLRPIIEKCLKKSLSERYSDVVDLIHDLSDYFKTATLEDKLQDLQKTQFDPNYQFALKECFPMPKIYVDPLDFGLARNTKVEGKIHPIIAHVFDDNSIVIGTILAEGSPMKKSLQESMALGFIKSYLHNLKKTPFVFKEFINELNTVCFESKLELNFSLIHTDRYMDELHMCYGGILAPLISKNKKIFSSPAGVKNAPLGAKLDELTISSHSFEIGDQYLIHNLSSPDKLLELEKLYINVSLYSAQILADTLIAKFSPSGLTSLIACQKVK